MMLMLLVAGLAIGCSSAPEAPAAPVPNLTEKEAIAIARSSTQGTPVTGNSGPRCWLTQPYLQPGEISTPNNFSHTESATFKPSGIWVVMAKSSWNWRKDKTGNWSGGECGYVVNDATGKVTQN